MGNDTPRIAGSSAKGPDDRVDREEPPGTSDALLAAFAHELRNALGPVRTAAHLLRASVRDDTHAQWALDLIDRQVHSITDSGDELADVVRINRGTLELATGVVDIIAALDSAASACSTTLAERRQALEWTRTAHRLTVRGDAMRLAQALAAVLGAASRTAVAGSRISVQTDRSDVEVEIRIREISESDPHGDDDSTLGRALLATTGLALARGIFALHGGSLCAAGRSQFTMRLPLAA